jgi:protein-S-isoprenylcysteine O-methyltransferase Ste14
MCFNVQTLTTIALVAGGAIIATPVLYKGFGRRGKGVFYENNFLIQRAPQLATLINVALIAFGFFASNNLINTPINFITSSQQSLPIEISNFISWLGIAILVSGLVFMIGGWYSLGECFSTDAEVLDGHTVRKNGLLKYVMHPAYSGIIQSLIGSSLAAVSAPAALFAIFVVAPLWLKRAKYEEGLLMESLGPDYKQYAEELKWRRLVPPFIPIGV